MLVTATDGGGHGQGASAQAHGPSWGNWMPRPVPSGKVALQDSSGSQSPSSMQGSRMVDGGGGVSGVQLPLMRWTLLHTNATPLNDAWDATSGRVVSTRAPVYWFRAT